MRYSKEQELYEAIRDSLIPDLLLYKENYTVCDCFSEDFKMQIELKCRRRHYDSLMIEYLKWSSLLRASKENKTRAIYINSTPKGVWVFDLNHLEKTEALEWEIQTLPAKTQWGKGETKEKKIAYLDLALGTDITQKLL